VSLNTYEDALICVIKPHSLICNYSLFVLFSIVYHSVHAWSGQCNKNLGNAFVIVWRIGDEHALAEMTRGTRGRAGSDNNNNKSAKKKNASSLASASDSSVGAVPPPPATTNTPHFSKC